MALGEIPLVFALLYAGGWTVVVAYTVGRACALLVLRPPAIRLAFNAAQFALGGALAEITFHAVSAGAGTGSPRVWLAAALAATVASACAVLMITAAVSFSEGRLSLDRVVASLRTDLTVTLANSSLGLCAAGLVQQDWRTAVLLVVPVAGMFLTMRAYLSSRGLGNGLFATLQGEHACIGAIALGDPSGFTRFGADDVKRVRRSPPTRAWRWRTTASATRCGSCGCSSPSSSTRRRTTRSPVWPTARCSPSAWTAPCRAPSTAPRSSSSTSTTSRWSTTRSAKRRATSCWSRSPGG
jgi:hypothetical protein